MKLVPGKRQHVDPIAELLAKKPNQAQTRLRTLSRMHMQYKPVAAWHWILVHAAKGKRHMQHSHAALLPGRDEGCCGLQDSAEKTEWYSWVNWDHKSKPATAETNGANCIGQRTVSCSYTPSANKLVSRCSPLHNGPIWPWCD